MPFVRRFLFITCVGILLPGCTRESSTTKDPPAPELPPITRSTLSKNQPLAPGMTLFKALDPTKSGIDPQLSYDPSHPLAHLEGSGMEAGGVAVGDIDGDDLPDVFIASAPGCNHLYRQIEPLRFEDITRSAGLDGDKSWSRGACIIDIDGDGDRDIFVANYGEPNRLYLNNGVHGDPEFTEGAAAAGLDLIDASLTPSFCDYDRDGDLDFYLVTNQYLWPPGLPSPSQAQLISERDGRPILNAPYDRYLAITDYRSNPAGGFDVKYDYAGRPDVLYRNNGDGTFSDVTVSAGMIPGNGRGLSASWWDYDNDGHFDLYVANDWGDRDFLYRNNGDGTFADVAETALPSTSMFSMGSDTGDLNDDGRMDLFCADMSGTNHYKRKISMGSMEASKTAFMVNARPPQSMRNAVFLGTGTPKVLEAAQLMGLQNSDWSWAVRILDLDNDGQNDVFVTNGMEKNIRSSEGAGVAITKAELRNEHNVAFRNTGAETAGGLRFESHAKQWGLDHFGFSLAAASSDLDRDGDLDLLVINRDEPPLLLENRSPTPGILLHLRDSTGKHDAIGAIVRLHTADGTQIRTILPNRGYLACDEAAAHFGLTAADSPAELSITWPGGHQQRIPDIVAGERLIIIDPGPDGKPQAAPETARPLFAERQMPASLRHRERPFDDFAAQPLLPNKLSQLGPGLAMGDLDGDGDVDGVLGGAAGSPTLVLRNDGAGTFAKAEPIANSEIFEDMGLLLLDVDADGDRDLFAVSGGVEPGSLQDRLYLNDGRGTFTNAPEGILPPDSQSGSSICAADVDRDGDLDLFIGGRVIPGQYPLAADSRLLRNDGGRFTDATEEWGPVLKGFGLVTGAQFADLDDDGWQDLVIAREWGAVGYLRNKEGQFTDQTAASGLADFTGWWNGVAVADLDRDGDLDFVASNFGLNTKYHASAAHPALLYYGDFGNGTPRCVEAEFEHETLFPVRGKSCSTRAIPNLATKFTSFHQFALADLGEIYSPPVLNAASRYAATTLRSGVFRNDGQGSFSFEPLPRLAQLAPGFGLCIADMNLDGLPDIAMAQNFYTTQPETGRMSGALGAVLLGTPEGEFSALWPGLSGLAIADDAKASALADFNNDQQPDLFVASNNGPLRHYSANTDTTESAFMARTIELRGSPSNPEAIGARITVRQGNTLIGSFTVQAGSGYLGQSPAKIFFSVPQTGQPAKISIRWPDASESSHEAAASEHRILIEKPQ